MKKVILILFVFLTQLNLFLVAQTIEINDQSEQFVEINNVFFLDNEKWMLGGKGETDSNSELYFKVVDSLSEKSLSLNSFEDITIEKFKGRGNTGYLLAMRNVDRVFGKCNFFNSQISFPTFLGIPADELFRNFEVLPNGDLVLVGSKIVNNEYRAFVKILKGSLSIAFEDYFSSGYFSDVVVTSDSTFIITGKFGDNQIFGGKIYNQYYEQLGDIMPDLESDQIFPIENNGYLLLKDQTIMKLNNDFQVENFVDFSSYGLMIAMEVDAENAFILYQKTGEAPMILRLNHALEVDHSFFVEDEYFQAKDMDVSENEIGIGGYLIPNLPFNNTSFLHPSTSGFFKTYSKNGMAEERELDIEITDVVIDDHEKKDSCGTPDAYLLNLKSIKVSLINRGTEPINNAEILVEVKGVEQCISGQGTPKFHIQRDELSVIRLDPGDTLKWRISAFEFPQNIQDSIAVELCIWLTTLENKRDINPDNNYFCGEVSLGNGYVEESIVFPTEGAFLIYPNPLDDIMKVSLLRAPFEPTKMEFYDYMGRELDLKYFIAPRAQYKEFDMSQLSRGFYYMRISNDIFEEIVRVYVN